MKQEMRAGSVSNKPELEEQNNLENKCESGRKLVKMEKIKKLFRKRSQVRNIQHLELKPLPLDQLT